MLFRLQAMCGSQSLSVASFPHCNEVKARRFVMLWTFLQHRSDHVFRTCLQEERRAAAPNQKQGDSLTSVLNLSNLLVFLYP